jgi:dynein heavy chain
MVSFRAQGLKIIDLQMADYMRILETAVQFGLPVLLQNVHEKLDPSLDPILNKSIVRVGGFVRYLFLTKIEFVF